MANRYWVGGTASWDATAGTKWALTSGGAGGQAVPTTADDVFFDATSGAVTVTAVTLNPVTSLSIDFTGFTGTFTGAVNLTVENGNMTLGAGMTYSHSGLIAFNGTGTLTTNGITITSSSFRVQTASGNLTIGDNLTSTSDFQLTQGTFNANNKTITITGFVSNNSNVRTLTMGSGLWTLTGTGGWDISTTTTTNLTFNVNTANIKITDTSASAVAFSGAGLTYNNLWFARGASTGANRVFASSTFNNLKDSGTSAHTLAFASGTTNTFTTFTVSGSAGNLISIDTPFGTTTHTLSCASGTISSDYLNIQHSIATGGATFYAGVNSTNNQATATAGSGWIFTAPPAGGIATKLLLMGTGKA